MIKNILTIFVSSAEIKSFFNQNRDILHYRRVRFIATIIETLMMLRMNTNKNQNIFVDDVEEKINNYANTNVFVKYNIFSSFDVFDKMNDQEKSVDLIILNEKTINVVFENEKNVEKNQHKHRI